MQMQRGSRYHPRDSRDSRDPRDSRRRGPLVTRNNSNSNVSVSSGGTTVPVNREETCPFLIRMFVKENEKFTEEHFKFKRADIQSDELHIYTWKDITLYELTDLVKSTYAPAQNRSARLSFSIVYPNKHGENVLNEIGNTYSSRSSPDGKKTLQLVNFEIGDYLAVSVSTNR
jgi:histone deacetylase complex subunit SAP18